ncbi:DHH family phosphoesterase [Thioalkalivibrio sp. K90mix]|uniref:single-stranded-DNA-specific exonuclease RecJ n=1 Tax=Thioalkalivibrio sp. (strain K90mix) TaxID=396595 RepID=UPI00036B7CF6|nr:DHH family phosphoesterase [Thioalkalivibrio sp. K90mix]
MTKTGSGAVAMKRWQEIEGHPDSVARAVEAGLTPFQAEIVAKRMPEADTDTIRKGFVDVRLANLDSPDTLPGIEAATERLVSAVLLEQVIAIETDHDVDGVTSHAILYRTLVHVMGHAPEKVQSYIGHRLKEGYGLSDAVVDRILAADEKPQLVVTADNGTADEDRIARLAGEGVDTIVTDHHAVPEAGPPRSAVACVSPARDDSAYPDTTIAGCMVAWLLAMRVYRQWCEVQGLDDPGPGRAALIDMLPEVALGTIADCVSLGESVNNRTIVRKGLDRINADDPRPCWRVAKRHTCQHGAPFTEERLAFDVGPRINARGRLDEAMAGVKFLLSKDEGEAEQWWSVLDAENTQRRAVEKAMKDVAIGKAEAQVSKGVSGIMVWMENGHSGVHGIVASRVLERYGRPTLCVSPVHESGDRVTGSARGVEGVHVERALRQVKADLGNRVMKFGGHAGAGGITLERSALDALEESWNAACNEQAQAHGLVLEPLLQVEAWPEGGFDDRRVRELEALAPFGERFRRPVYALKALIQTVKAMGQEKTHLRLALKTDGGTYGAVYFNAAEPGGETQWRSGQSVWVAASVGLNHYMGHCRLQLVVREMRPANQEQAAV